MGGRGNLLRNFAVVESLVGLEKASLMVYRPKYMVAVMQMEKIVQNFS